MRVPDKVRLVEVGPRDGLQNEAVTISTAVKVALIERLSAAGLPAIEVGAFVSPRWVPQMADTAEVCRRIAVAPGTVCSVLVPNRQGLEAALAAGMRSFAVFTAASESFCRRNINCSIAESLDRFAPVIETATAAGGKVRGYVSCALGCPYEGAVAPSAVTAVAEKLYALGCSEISLGDTIGVGTPMQAREMVAAVADRIPVAALAAHFHDTYGQALANLLAVMDLGVAVIDASVAGLGGCPYAEGASGNVASEDVLYMLNGLGSETGVDLDRLIAAGRFICEALGRPTGSKVAGARPL